MKPRGGSFKKGHIVTKEIRDKISLSKKGKKLSDEHKRRISIGNMGKKMSDEAKRKTAEANRIRLTGKKQSAEHVAKRVAGRKGYIHSEETRRKISDAQKGEKSRFWKGGITPESKMIRRSIEFRLWREAVFNRDNYTCVWCGLKFVKGVTGRVVLHPDHIKPFCNYPELRFAIDNGRTLCKSCHEKTDTYGYKAIKH